MMENDFRHFCEECDNLQGFQILSDAYKGFSGYSNGFAIACKDEYPKTPILFYSLSSKKANVS